MRIVHELIGPAQGRVGHARPREPLRQLRARIASHLLGDARGQPAPGGHALGIVVEAGVGEEIAERELLAEALPVPVGGDADEDLLAVGGREELVDPQPMRVPCFISGKGTEGSPVAPYWASHCPTQNTVVSKRPEVMRCPRPVFARC